MMNRKMIMLHLRIAVLLFWLLFGQRLYGVRRWDVESAGGVMMCIEWQLVSGIERIGYGKLNISRGWNSAVKGSWVIR